MLTRKHVWIHQRVLSAWKVSSRENVTFTLANVFALTCWAGERVHPIQPIRASTLATFTHRYKNEVFLYLYLYLIHKFFNCFPEILDKCLLICKTTWQQNFHAFILGWFVTWNHVCLVKYTQFNSLNNQVCFHWPPPILLNDSQYSLKQFSGNVSPI